MLCFVFYCRYLFIALLFSVFPCIPYFPIMDVDLLDRDELALELLVRGIGGTDADARTRLIGRLTDEVDGVCPPPDRPHGTFRSLTNELSDVRGKIGQIGSDLHALVESHDDRRLQRCRSRLLHLQGRMYRLKSQTGYHAQVGRVEADLDGLFQRVQTLMCAASSEVVGEGAQGGAGAVKLLVDVLSRPTSSADGSHTSTPPNAGVLARPAAPLPSDGFASVPVRPVAEELQLPGGSQAAASSSELVENPFRLQAGAPPSFQPPLADRGPPQGPPQMPRHQAPMAWQPNFGSDAAFALVSRGVAPPSEPAAHLGSIPAPHHIPVPVPNRGVVQAPYEPLPRPVAEQYPRVGPFAPAPAVDPRAHAAVPQGLANGWTMLKWPLRFGGGPKDLPVEEFIFRVETLARVGNVSEAALAVGLHQILVDAAASCFWVYIRGHPDATWAQVKAELVFAFRSGASDTAIMRQIHDRLQRQGERFMEFCLAIQELASRLRRPLAAAEMLDVVRRNMAPAYQDRLLFRPVATLHELQDLCQQVEEMWRSQNEVHQSRRAQTRVSEIAALDGRAESSWMSHWPNQPPSSPWWPADDIHSSQPPPVASFPQYVPQSQQLHTVQQHDQPATDSFGASAAAADEQYDWVCAMDASATKRGEFAVCWNCDDLGHTFMDCTVARKVFCYGCGTKNVFRPRCPK